MITYYEEVTIQETNKTYVNCHFLRCNMGLLKWCQFYDCMFFSCQFMDNINNCCFYGTFNECEFNKLTIEQTQIHTTWKTIFKNCFLMDNVISVAHKNEYIDCDLGSNAHIKTNWLKLINCQIDIYDRGLNAYLLKDHPELAIDMLYSMEMCTGHFIKKYGKEYLKQIIDELREKGIIVAYAFEPSLKGEDK